ncbi:DegT/DnrJ/EryC1/StrS family aminotransferase [Shinella sp.]|uniref:DegT/DnrJ/EryC1/StrS family aminotransferase n=1 Tax=Shinella sp. TaxID=1870904 RepID=UPI0039E52064
MMKNIPFALPDITAREIAAVTECLSSGWLTTGKKCREFEDRFASFVGARHAVAVNSATAAALLILDCLEAARRDLLFVSPYTFSGPAMMAHQLGMRVVLVDVEPGGFNMDPDALEEALSTHPGYMQRIVMPTHFAGQSCRMVPILESAGSRLNCLVVDDAAHALPSHDVNTGFSVGAQGAKATFFSFYATKTLTTGEGGMIATDDEELAVVLRAKRMHGFNRQVFDRYTNLTTGWRYDIAQRGWKANLTDVAAALGIVQLERQMEMLGRRRSIAERYNRAFAGTGAVLPQINRGHACHLYPLQVDRRDEFIAGMAEAGVQCSVHFIPLHHHSYWRSQLNDVDCPNADAAFAREVSLPIYSGMSDDDVDYVIGAALRLLTHKEAA